METACNYVRAVAALLAVLGDNFAEAYEDAREALPRAAHGNGDEEREALETLRTPDAALRRRFEREVLTAGGMAAALPVESLYAPWSCGRGRDASEFGASRHLYLGDSAQHVLALYDRLEVKVPPAFAAMPDHAVLLGELAALYAEAGNSDAAATFLRDHFGWLDAYDRTLAERQQGLGLREGLQDARRDELAWSLAHGRALVAQLSRAVTWASRVLDKENDPVVGS